ncbi:ExbD/TolR family protein [Roseivirga pacifica]
MKYFCIIILLLFTLPLLGQKDPCESFTPELKKQIFAQIDSFELELVEKGYLLSRTPEGYNVFVKQYAPNLFEDLSRGYYPLLDSTVNNLTIGDCPLALVDETEMETVLEWELKQLNKVEEAKLVQPEDAGKYIANRINTDDFRIRYVKNKVMLTAYALIYGPDDPSPSLGSLTKSFNNPLEPTTKPAKPYSMQITLDSANNLRVNGEISDMENLSAISREFIDVHRLDGYVQIDAHSKSLYDTFIQILDALNRVYNEFYDQISLEQKGKKYADLPPAEREEIRKHLEKDIRMGELN